MRGWFVFADDLRVESDAAIFLNLFGQLFDHLLLSEGLVVKAVDVGAGLSLRQLLTASCLAPAVVGVANIKDHLVAQVRLLSILDWLINQHWVHLPNHFADLYVGFGVEKPDLLNGRGGLRLDSIMVD